MSFLQSLYDKCKTLSLIYHCICSFSIVLLFSCSSSSILTKKEKKALYTQIEQSPIFTKSHTGFALYDPLADEMLCEYDADILFTPASNTKLFTLYTATKILGDSVPALRYMVRGDSLIFWGTGDPSLWHPDLPISNHFLDFFQHRTEQLFYCSDNFIDNRYGAGWAWDDYVYSYQVEKSALPVYGNSIYFEKEQMIDTLSIIPNYFSAWIRDTLSSLRTNPRFKRSISDNAIQLEGSLTGKNKFRQILPFKYSDSLVVQLLEDRVHKPINLIHYALPDTNFTSIYSIASDSVYKVMMHNSDNFLAEQLLLLCANEVFDTLSTPKIIQYTKDTYLLDMPDPMRWVDGSGLSRYNLFTPRTIIQLLRKIYSENTLDRIITIFPAIDTSSEKSIREGKPFVYAKTGTLSNKHCLSGYLFTKSNKPLIFSFMHNNYFGSSAPLRKEMNNILRQLHEAH